MNPALLVFGAGMGGNIRKQVLCAGAALIIILALPFMAVFSMGGNVLTFLVNVPNLAVAEAKGFYTGGVIEGDTYAWGNCTYWAFAMRLKAGNPIPTSWGNANTWDDHAIKDGYDVNHIPTVGAIFQTDEGNLGHVAYVIDVNNQTGKWTISEMNYAGLNIVGTRTFSKESASRYSFIHNKQGASEWIPLPISLPSLTTQ